MKKIDRKNTGLWEKNFLNVNKRIGNIFKFVNYEFDYFIQKYIYVRSVKNCTKIHLTK